MIRFSKKIKVLFFLAILLTVPCFAKASNLPNEPLIHRNNLTWQGAFYFPSLNSSDPNHFGTSNGADGLSYNPINNSLFVQSYRAAIKLGEINIPPILTSNFNNATIKQNPIDPTNQLGCYLAAGRTNLCDTGGPTLAGVQLGGTLVDSVNKILYGSVYVGYDTGGAAQYSHYKDNLDWSLGVGTVGMFGLGSQLIDSSSPTGFLNMYMGWIPSEWQTPFGGKKALAGSGLLNGLSTHSMGPSLVAFNPGDLTNINSVTGVTSLVYYPVHHETLGAYGPVYYQTGLSENITSDAVVFPQGTSSVIVFGRTGRDSGCYGGGTIHPEQRAGLTDMANWVINNNSKSLYNSCYALHSADIITNPDQDSVAQHVSACIVASGGTGYTCGSNNTMTGMAPANCCYDPGGSDEGAHSWPYRYIAQVYSAYDLLHVASGDIIGSERSANIDASCANGTVYQPWCVKPYEIWDFNLS